MSTIWCDLAIVQRAATARPEHAQHAHTAHTNKNRIRTRHTKHRHTTQRTPMSTTPCDLAIVQRAATARPGLEIGAARTTRKPCTGEADNPKTAVGSRQTQGPVVLILLVRMHQMSRADSFGACVVCMLCVSWGQQTQRADRRTTSGISFPEKLTAGFLGGERHQDVDTIRA